MVLTMTCLIMTNNPLIDFELMKPDVIVTYDHNKERFFVTFVATNTGYVVDRGHLVNAWCKYEDHITREILSTIDEDIELYRSTEFDKESDLDIAFSGRAYNEIHAIWMANCDLF